jgi:peroxiredoxin
MQNVRQSISGQKPALLGFISDLSRFASFPMLQNAKWGKTMLLSLRLSIATLLMFSAGLIHGAEVSGKAPDFVLKSNTSENLQLKDQVGNVVMINFWASWCGPCRQEMPRLEEIYQKYSKFGFTILAVSVDEDTLAADKFMNKVKVTFPYLYDNSNKVSELYAVEAMPTTILVDRSGQKRFLHKGYQPGFEQKYLKEVKLLIRE